ncbi:MAG TPA: DUF6494 family protein [Gemmatimonadales bacterium]|nr:DUF6494 family protein [Gemmatimonadales bacterium]
MNEETFNLEVRKFLKKFGVTAQREIERGVGDALKAGRLKGTERLRARAVLTLDGVSGEIRVEDEIALE